MELTSIIKIAVRRLLTSKYSWRGDYVSWKDASLHCSGYDSNQIIEKVKIATAKVRNNEAVYERDSVIFDRVYYSWPLLSVLMWVSALNKGKLNVIDFGGSLGSSYFQNKLFLDTIDQVRWSIVEQRSFVKHGSELMQDDRLKFFYTLKDAVEASGPPDILLVSCTLPYIEDPYSFLLEMVQYKIPYFVLDNTPFNYKDRDRITIQKVHPSIYEASYPCWLLNFDKVIKTIEKSYEIIADFENDSHIYVDGRKVKYRGFLAKLKA